MRQVVTQRLKEAVEAARAAGEIGSGDLPELVFEMPKRAEQGDLATPVAMSLAKLAGKPPRQIAQALMKRLPERDSVIERVEVAGPGYINFFFHKAYWHQILRQVLAEAEAYGRSNLGQGQRVQIEFVSANPTGPLHVGHGRGAAVGDVLANLLEATGYRVWREYYINDVGTQMEILGRSVMMRYGHLEEGRTDLLGQPLPEGYYQGGYVAEIARAVREAVGERARRHYDAGDWPFFSEFAREFLLNEIRGDLEAFGVRFDAWFNEKRLYEEGVVEQVLEQLRQAGCLYESEGAEWLKTSELGDEKDRVVRRRDERHTYFASDIAYHQHKFSRGFDRVIDIWGADHHGYIPRMRAAMRMLGHSPEALQVLVVQLVHLLRGGRPVPMSTRAGSFVTLREVIDEVGRDAARFIFLMRRCDSHLDFDLELAKKQSSENPVYYVQYAHARVCSVEAVAGERGIDIRNLSDAEPALLDQAEEIALIRQLAFFPDLVEDSARSLEPHRLTYYLQDLAGLFHNYYNHHRIIGDDLGRSKARLLLALAVRTVIANALRLLGVTAPRSM